MINFEEMFEMFLENIDQVRIDSYGGYPSEKTIYKGRAFVATVSDKDAPQLDEYDMKEVRELIVMLVQIFCEEKGVSSYEEIEGHPDYGEFWDSFVDGMYQIVN